MSVKIEFIELKLCEKVGNILVECQKECKTNDFDILMEWLTSETFQNIITGDVALCSQAKSYITRTFLLEKQEKLDSVKMQIDIPEKAMYWFGYIMTYWCFAEKKLGNDIAREYDILKVVNGYEMYHTLGVLHAIDKIKEDCKLWGR